MDEHTQGPWAYTDEEPTGETLKSISIFAGDDVIATVYARPRIALQANARLIAAAPDLHKVLADTVAGRYGRMLPADFLDAARAALAKVSA